MKRFSLYAAALATFTISFPNILLIDGPVNSLSQVAILLAGLIATIHVLLRRKCRPPHIFHLATATFVLLGFLSVGWSVAPEATYYRLAVHLELCILLFVLWHTTTTASQLHAHFKAYVLGALGSGVSIVYNYVNGITATYAPEQRFSAVGYDPNDIAAIIAISIPVAWYLSTSDTVRHSRLLWKLYPFAAILFVILTGSRTGLAATIVSVAYVLFELRHSVGASKVPLIIVACILPFAIQELTPSITWERYSMGINSVHSGDFSGRATIWSAGLDLFRENPILGIGSGAFQDAVQNVLGYERSSHNSVVSIGVELGLVGLVIYAWILGLAFTSALRTRNSRKRNLAISLLTVGAVASMTLEWDYRKPTWFVLSTVMALSMRERERSGEHNRVTSPNDRLTLTRYAE